MKLNLPTYSSWDTPQRQARGGLLIILFKSIVSIIKTLWPIVLIVVLKKKEGIDMVDIVLAALAAFILARSIVSFFYFRFYIIDNELTIKKGFISKQTIVVALEKIQAVHIEQDLLHQLMNIVKVKIDTAGSEKAEVVIDALEGEKAERLKAFLLHEQQVMPAEGTAIEPAEEVPFIRLSIKDLLKMGIFANHMQAFFAILGFALSLLLELEGVFGDKVKATVHNPPHIAGLSLTTITLLITCSFFILIVVSLAKIFLNYYNFSLSETLQGFRLKTGLINARQYLVRFSKIQFLSWKANWIHRMLGLYRLEFHQASGDHVNHLEKTNVPVNSEIDLRKITEHYHEQLPGKEDSVHRIHGAYPFRKTLLSAILPVAALLLIVQLLFFKSWFFWIALWIIYVFITAVFFRKNFRLYIAPDAFQINSGVWGRSTKIVKWDKIQHVVLQQSIYQRHKQLASLQLSTAGGSVHIPYISLELAQLIQNYALYKVERSNEAWM